MEDWQFDIAIDACDSFTNPLTRLRIRALLRLARGAGLDPTDIRYITGACVRAEPSAGVWVDVPAPGATRPIPVLARHGPALLDLATGRESLTLITGTAGAAGARVTSQLSTMINRAISRAGYDFTISVERLRKAWLAEHVEANTPINTLLAAAGLTSLRTLEELITIHGPLPPTSTTALAWELGGLARSL